MPCFSPPWMLQSCSVFLSYSLRCLGRSSTGHWVHPRTIQSGGWCRASLRPGCSKPVRLFNVFSPLPRTLQSWPHPRTIQSRGWGCASFRPGCSNPGRLFVLFFPLPRTFHPVAPGSPPNDPVGELVPCFVPSRTLHSGAPFNRILSFASDAPVRGTGFTPGQSSPGAIAVLLAAPDAPIRGVIFSYSLRCPGRSSPWHRVHPRTIQSGGYCRASCRPGCSYPGRLFFSFSLRCLGCSRPWHRVQPRTIQSGG